MGFLRKRSLFWVLGFALVAIQSVAMLTLAWFTLGRVSVFAREQTLDNLAWVAPLLEKPYTDFLSRGAEWQEIDEYTKLMGRRVGVRITFITPEGVVLGDSHHDVPSMDNHDTRPEIGRAHV